MLIKDLTRTDGRWIKRLQRGDNPLEILKDYEEFEKEEMNSKDFIEEKKRGYLKTEACDWDCHEYCEKEISVGSKTSPCLCSCHRLAHANGEMPVSQDTYDKLYDPRFDGKIS